VRHLLLGVDCGLAHWMSPLYEKCRGQVCSATYRVSHGWQRGVVVSGVRRMIEVNPRRARLVPVVSTWMGDRFRAVILVSIEMDAAAMMDPATMRPAMRTGCH